MDKITRYGQGNVDKDISDMLVRLLTQSPVGIFPTPEVNILETNRIVVDSGGNGDYTTIQAAINYIAGVAAGDAWLIDVRSGLTGNYDESLDIGFTLPLNVSQLNINGLGLVQIRPSANNAICAANYVTGGGARVIFSNIVFYYTSGTISSYHQLVQQANGGYSVYYNCAFYPSQMAFQSAGTYECHDCYFEHLNSVNANYVGLIGFDAVNNATYKLYNCNAIGWLTSNGSSAVVIAADGTAVEIHGGRYTNKGTAYVLNCVPAESGTLSVLRVGYDTTKTNGTITVLDGDVPTTIPAGSIPLARGSLLVGNSSGVAAAVGIGGVGAFVTNDGTDTKWSTGFLSITTGKTLTVSDSATIANAALTLANTKVLTLTNSLTNQGGNDGILSWSGAYTLTIAGNASVSGTNTGDQTLPVGANPTASVGLTAVNGSAATFLRSDGAPAISQAIAPTWTGTHIWTPGTNGTSTAIFNDHSGAVILNVDSTNKRVGVGTATPAYPLQVAGSVDSFVSGATALFTAYNPGANFPRAQFQIGNSSSDTNVNIYIAPLFSSAGVQKPAGITVATNKDAADSGEKEVILYVTTTQSFISSLKSDLTGDQSTANPLYFAVGNVGATRNGLIINNDADNKVTMGSDSVMTVGQVNVTSRSDQIQLYVKGYTTQTLEPFAVERNDTAAGIKTLAAFTALGSGSNGDGGEIELLGKSSTTIEQNMLTLDWLWATATHASRKARGVINVWDTAAREALRIEASGSAAMIGFLGAAAAVQQAATVDLGTVLSNFGLRAAGPASLLAVMVEDQIVGLNNDMVFI